MSGLERLDKAIRLLLELQDHDADEYAAAIGRLGALTNASGHLASPHEPSMAERRFYDAFELLNHHERGRLRVLVQQRERSSADVARAADAGCRAIQGEMAPTAPALDLYRFDCCECGHRISDHLLGSKMCSRCCDKWPKCSRVRPRTSADICRSFGASIHLADLVVLRAQEWERALAHDGVAEIEAAYDLLRATIQALNRTNHAIRVSLGEEDP